MFTETSRKEKTMSGKPPRNDSCLVWIDAEWPAATASVKAALISDFPDLEFRTVVGTKYIQVNSCNQSEVLKLFKFAEEHHLSAGMGDPRDTSMQEPLVLN